MHDYNELYHHGVKGMKWGVRKKTYSDKEVSDYRKRKIAEAPLKSESPRGANKGWYKNAPKSTLVRQMRTEEKMLIKNEKAMKKVKKSVIKAQSDAKKYVDFVNSHTYSVAGSSNKIFIDNKRLYAKAKKSERKTNQIVSKLNKKYGNVSTIIGNDVETGRAYCDIIFGNKKERIFA